MNPIEDRSTSDSRACPREPCFSPTSYYREDHVLTFIAVHSIFYPLDILTRGRLDSRTMVEVTHLEEKINGGGETDQQLIHRKTQNAKNTVVLIFSVQFSYYDYLLLITILFKCISYTVVVKVADYDLNRRSLNVSKQNF